MKNTAYILLVFLLSVLTNNLQAQSYPLINKELLFNLIDADDQHDFFTVFIFTNGCIGGKYINAIENELDSITNGKTKFILAQSSRGKDRGDELEKAITAFKLNKDDIYLIDDSKYKVSSKDSRKQGMLFRDDLCYECKFMTIGTVYKLVFDKNKTLLYHGFMFDMKQVAAILSCK